MNGRSYTDELEVGADERSSSSYRELARYWPVLAASILGITVGVAAVPGQAIAVALHPMHKNLGWSTEKLSLGPTIMLLALGASSPLLGWLVDRVRPISICVGGLFGLALSLLLFSRVSSSISVYYVDCALVGVLGAGSATVPYARIINASFARARGLALGIATAGTGLAAFALPVLLAPYVTRFGWRQGFVLLAGVVGVAALVVALLMGFSPAATHSPRKARRATPGTKTDLTAETGVAFGKALRDRTFWTLFACVGLVSLAIAGLQLHLIAYLEDSGVDASSAASVAGIAGITVIACRVLAGWVYDRVFAPYVTAGVMALAAACALGLATLGKDAGFLGAIAIGLASGTEFDVIGYLTGRYFGVRSYGRIYGVYYFLYLGGSAISMVAYGAVDDVNHSYVPAIYGSGALLIVCAILYLTLRRYPSLSLAGSRPVRHVLWRRNRSKALGAQPTRASVDRYSQREAEGLDVAHSAAVDKPLLAVSPTHDEGSGR